MDKESEKNPTQNKIDKTNYYNKELYEMQKRKVLLQEFQNLNFNSITDVVIWIGKMAVCKNDIFANFLEVLPILQEKYSQIYSKLVDENSNKNIDTTVEEYIVYDGSLDEAGKYIISRAISDIKYLGRIDCITGWLTEIYINRLEKQNKIDNDFSRS